MALTDSTDDDRAARIERALERAAEVLQRVDAALQEPRPDPAEADRRWREYEAGRRAREDERAWEQSLERHRAPSPQPAPAPAPKPAAPAQQYLTLASFEHILSEYIKGQIPYERALWREEIASLKIQVEALAKGRINDDEQ